MSEALIEEANIAVNNDEFLKAEELLSQILNTQVHPEDKIKCLLLLAQIGLKTNDIDKCKRSTEEVLSIDKDNIYAKCQLISLYNNELVYKKAYEISNTIDVTKLPLDFIHAFTQAVIKQGNYQKFNELGNIFDIFDYVNPEILPSYIGINGIRNRVFKDETVNQYLSLQLKWGNHLKDEAKQNPLTNLNKQNKATGKVTIGFYGLSNIFDTQSVLGPFINYLDKNLFYTKFAFVENGQGVVTTDKFKQLFNEVTVIPRGPLKDIAKGLRELNCDILIDLNGLQQPATALGAMAWRVAPVQMSWTGRPITAGLPELDYNIVDEVLTGDGTGTLTNTLNLSAFACFGKMQEFELADTLPSETNNYITYGINAEPAKFNLHTIDMWAKVIKRTKDSKLAFLRPEYESHYLQENILKEFKSRGVKSEQIEFWYEKTQNREHMKLYNKVDVLLDCYPMTGGIGMIEALHMGVPAVSLEGPAIQLRVGASHLHAVGLDDLRVKTVKRYVDIALKLAKDTERRKELRQSLRDKLSQSAFCNLDLFGNDFNDKMKGLVEKHKLMPKNSVLIKPSLPGDF